MKVRVILRMFGLTKWAGTRDSNIGVDCEGFKIKLQYAKEFSRRCGYTTSKVIIMIIYPFLDVYVYAWGWAS
jgi:hypothetical protein